jgi:hypothetical protein
VERAMYGIGCGVMWWFFQVLVSWYFWGGGLKTFIGCFCTVNLHICYTYQKWGGREMHCVGVGFGVSVPTPTCQSSWILKLSTSYWSV